MPRVLRIMNRLSIGGPILNVAYLTKFLPPEFETLLLIGEKEAHEKSAAGLLSNLGVKYKVINDMERSLNPLKDLKAYRQLKQTVASFKPDIIHTHAAKSGALGRLVGFSASVPAIVHTFHGHVFHSYFNPWKTKAIIQVERYLARKSNAIVAISEQQKKELVQDFRIAPDEKVRVIPLGFDLDKFKFDQDNKRKKFREEFHLDDDTIAIGIIGRLVPVKNHNLFIDAIKYIQENTSKQVRAFIVGDGDLRKQLEERVVSHGLAFSVETDARHPHPVVFTSWRNDIDVVNAGLDIVCLTSLNEGTPVSLIEAQAANKPVVSTRVGGIEDIVIEDQTALLSGVHDSEGFFLNLLRVVNDDVFRRKLGENGSGHVSEKFAYQRLVKDMSALYRELLSPQGMV